MSYKEAVQFLAMIFIAAEIFKFFIPNIMWENSKKSIIEIESEKRGIDTGRNIKSNHILRLISLIYLGFVIMTLFTEWFWVGILIISLSAASYYTLKKPVEKNEKLNFNIFIVLFLDGLLSILLLSIINPIIFELIKI